MKKSTALATVAVSSLLAISAANANPFVATAAKQPVAAKKADAKCGEGKCGGKKQVKKADAKCGEAKCGGHSKKADAKCGEGKCGGKK